MSAEAILTEDLCYAYRKSASGRPALDGLSFAAHPGEIFGLLGPNGAGKTTTVRILTTLLKPTGGKAYVAGHDVAREPLAARRCLAAVLQESAVETLLSTWDNLLLYGTLHGYSRRQVVRRAEEVVELLELRETLGERAGRLSGGFKRRLQVAKALMVETPVLFLDEATTGMDPLVKRRTLDAIRRQAAAGRTVLRTTQALEEAEALYLVLMFVSSLFYPAETLPDWIRWMAWANPVTWEVDVLRYLTTGAGDAARLPFEAAGYAGFTALAFWSANRSLNGTIE